MKRCVLWISCILLGASPALADYSFPPPARRYHFVLSPNQIFAVNNESLTAYFYDKSLVAPHDAKFYGLYIDSNVLCAGGGGGVLRQRVALVQAAFKRGQSILVEIDNEMHALYMQPFDAAAEYERYVTPNDGYYDTIDALKAIPISNAGEFVAALARLEQNQKQAFLQDKKIAMQIGQHEAHVKSLQDAIVRLQSTNRKLQNTLWIMAGVASAAVAGGIAWRIRRRQTSLPANTG